MEGCLSTFEAFEATYDLDAQDVMIRIPSDGSSALRCGLERLYDARIDTESEYDVYTVFIKPAKNLTVTCES